MGGLEGTAAVHMMKMLVSHSRASASTLTFEPSHMVNANANGALTDCGWLSELLISRETSDRCRCSDAEPTLEISVRSSGASNAGFYLATQPPATAVRGNKGEFNKSVYTHDHLFMLTAK